MCNIIQQKSSNVLQNTQKYQNTLNYVLQYHRFFFLKNIYLSQVPNKLDCCHQHNKGKMRFLFPFLLSPKRRHKKLYQPPRTAPLPVTMAVFIVHSSLFVHHCLFLAIVYCSLFVHLFIVVCLFIVWLFSVCLLFVCLSFIVHSLFLHSSFLHILFVHLLFVYLSLFIYRCSFIVVHSSYVHLLFTFI